MSGHPGPSTDGRHHSSDFRRLQQPMSGLCFVVVTKGNRSRLYRGLQHDGRVVGHVVHMNSGEWRRYRDVQQE